MSMARSLALVSATALVVVACGGGSPQPVVMPPAHITGTPPAPPPVRARWVFSHPDRGFAAKLDLGDGSTLYVGNGGRRELAKGDAPLVDAGTLALADLVGVLRDDKKQLVFVGEDGGTYTATDPLGELSAMKPGPIADPKPGATKLFSPTTGKSSILGIHPADRKLMRSSDFGATWKAVDYAGATKPYGKAVSVALDDKGNGLLLHLPQRLFVTKDDGATWSPLASPGIGARRVFRDGSGRVFLDGYSGSRAKLDNGALAVTTETPAPIYKPPALKLEGGSGMTAARERGESKTILTGDHIVELTQIDNKKSGKPKEIEILSLKIGEKATDKDKPIVNADLIGEGLSQTIAGWGSNLAYLRVDDDTDSENETATLFRSKDYGATWAKEAVLQGSSPTSGEGTPIAVGPKGWTYVTSLCPNEHDEEAPSGGDCSKRQIRPANAAGFEDMVFVEEFAPQAFAFDEAHDKVYALGDHDSNTYVYESPLSQNKFTRTKLDLSTASQFAIGVDAKGVLRAMGYDSGKRQWILHRRGADGKDMPSLYVPLDRGEIQFVGGRGILFSGHKGWETNDGGETWIRVAVNGSVRDLSCTDAGCVNGDAQRVGWDLPAVQATDKVLAQTEPVAQPSQKTQLPPNPQQPVLDLACKPTGAATPLTFVPGTELLDGRSPEMRWASIKNETDGRMSIVVGTKTAVKTLPLLAAEPKPAPPPPGAKPAPVAPMEHRQGQRTLSDGVVTARYAFAPANGGPYNPVDVDLTWWSSATGKTQHKLLPKVKPFRVSRYGFSGSSNIVDGGILFQGARGEPAFYVHDDGKVETLPLPANASIDEADRVGKRWLVTDWDGWTARTNVSDDNGASWKSKAWGLDEGGSIALTAIGGKATLNLTHGGQPALLFGLDATLPDDPPAPIVVDATVTTDVPCDAQSGRQRFVNYIPYERRTVKVKIDEPKTATTAASVTQLSATTRITHDMPNGKVCTSAYALTGAQTAFIYPEAKGWSGWRFRRNVDPKEKQATWFAEALTCQ